jgi:pimeloyl-ACP methyl ester carboxylesterase
MTAFAVKAVRLPNGETYGYRQYGEGPRPMLFVHGNMTSSKHMELLMVRFSPRVYTIIAVDLRGFGLSSYVTPINGLPDLSEDLQCFCDTIGWKQFTLLGWSTGGGVGMQFVADYAGYADRLILLTSMSTRGYPFYALDEALMPIRDRRLTTREQIGEQARNRAVQDAYERKDKATLRAVWEAVIYTHCRPSEPLYEEYLSDMLTQRNLMDIYHGLNVFNISHIDNPAAPGTGAVDRITVPTLIIASKRDYVVTDAMTHELIADLEHARVVWLEDCGHSPLIDQMDALVEAIDSFIA